ncbi:MAG: hypothetical protein IKN32_09260 [Bacteroidales bacterium]|nr:hypothetical protein [Bacteroidales bacterium]
MRNELLDKIYAATNNGLDIILWYYPQAQGCDRPNKYFKIRSEERTASAKIKVINGVWRVTDFGDEGHAMSPINVCMKEEGKEFKEALLTLAQRYGVSESINAQVNRAKVEKRDATPEEKEGSYEVKVREKMTDAELELLGPLVTQEICDRFSYYALEWYKFTKDRKTYTIQSNENYPIFMHECGDFKKIYQPLSPEKQHRFRYLGTKPKDYINGFDELKKKYENWKKEQEEKQEKKAKEEEIGIKQKTKYEKLPEAIICSGERDALNCAGLGYSPLWLNSESADLDPASYAKIMSKVEILYNVPDIDETGVRMATELAKKYIDIRTVELPESIRTYNDYRGKPRKDLRDWVDTQCSSRDRNESDEVWKERRKREQEKARRRFREMLDVAKPCRFWEKTYAKDKVRYEINTLYLLHFLRVHGFGKLVDPDNDVVTYVHTDGFKVKQISPRNIQDFVIAWAKERKLEVEIQNLILNSTRMSSGVFEKIDTINPDFTNFDEHSQTLFFRNKVVHVTADAVEESRYPKGGIYAWDKTVCNHDFKRIEPSFTAEWNKDDGTFGLKLNHTKSHYFRFLMNASRIYWREELEDRASNDPAKEKAYFEQHHWDIFGPRLTEEEQMEQQQHLANKLFTIGYLMHSHKSLSKAWCVWIMENKITEEDESSGGSGKTFMVRFLKQFKDTELITGRDKKVTENTFFLDRVTESTDLLLIDDAVKYFNFNYFYSMITDNMVVNYKNARSKEIDFEVSPKLVVTSNFPPPANDGSTARRILNCVFSDFYHKQTDNNDYRESRRIADDFGYDLYDRQYKQEWWNEDLNFCIDCLQFYLQSLPYNVILMPPMENVDRRMRQQDIGTEFLTWAEVYFAQGSGYLDRPVLKSAAKEDLERESKLKYTANSFTRRLKTFCKLHTDYIEAYNPEQCKGFDIKQKRIVRRQAGNPKPQEFIYLKTYGTPINDEMDGQPPAYGQ